MKNAIVILLFAISATAFSQCKVTLAKLVRRDSVGVQFTLQLSRGNDLTSNEEGVLMIPRDQYRQLQNSEVQFELYNDSDRDYYRIPMWTRTRRRLSEYCGQHLVITDRF